MFENKKVKVRDTQTECGWYEVYISRLIASWHNAGGQHYRGAFEEWLKTLGLDDDTIRYICNVANNGKLELETDARKFIESYNPNNYYIDFREFNMDEDFIKLNKKMFEKNYKIP